MLITVTNMLGEDRFNTELDYATSSMVENSMKDSSVQKTSYSKYTEIPLYDKTTHVGYLRRTHVISKSTGTRISRSVFSVRLKPKFFNQYRASNPTTLPYTMQTV